MIPKIIHYCWFGRNPLPKSAIKCIESWKQFFPDYQIKEWNEDNFNVNITPYTREAYEKKKYAFVSDYARYWILYNYGGLYFDTDVEILKSFDSIIEKGPFMGAEKSAFIQLENNVSLPGIAPGLGLGAHPKMDIYKKFLDYYNNLHFIQNDGQQAEGTIVTHTTKILHEYGLKEASITEPIQIAGLWIYPDDYFCPMDSTTGIVKCTENTVSIHLYDASWLNHHTVRYQLHLLKNRINKILGFSLFHLFKTTKKE